MARVATVFVLACAAAMSPARADLDQDTLCASVYALLAESARNAGLESSGFQSALNTAQSYHLAAYPYDDPQRYSLSVIDAAQTLRAALADGRLTTATILSTANSCNTRYSSAASR